MPSSKIIAQGNITSYKEALEFTQSKNPRKLCGNTVVNRHSDGKIVIRFYSTNIITYFPDGRVQLSNGGYASPTTKHRINQFSPFYIQQKGFEWFVTGHNDPINGPLKFEDGMILQS